VLELRATAFDIVSIHAAAQACDAVMSEAGACRVAPDEAMLIGSPGAAPELVARITEAVDAHAVVLDETDGWMAWSLHGEDARHAASYLSPLELPGEGFIQGDVAHLPAKVLVRDGAVHVLVPAMLGHELRRRILARCGHLGLVEAAS
jgi:sarcosine oxidase gamma subunit